MSPLPTLLVIAAVAAAVVAASAPASIEHDTLRNVLVSTVALEAPNLPANMTLRLATAAQQIDAAICSVCDVHGECVWRADRYERCACDAGWTGETCVTALRACECENNGTCVADAVRGGVCVCREGYAALLWWPDVCRSRA
jgi:hypothetical protein